MSWRDRLPTSMRSGNPNFTAEAREARRQELEAKRLETARKKKARQAFLAAGISAPSSPSTSRAPSPVKDHLESLNLPINTIQESAIEDDLLSLPGDIQLPNSIMAELFEDKTGEDDKDAWKKGITVKFNKSDVEYFFTAAEAEMKRFGINKQLSKRDALLPQLPEDVIDECKPLLRIPEADLGDHPYRDLKQEIISIFGKKPQDAFARAKARTLTARQLWESSLFTTSALGLNPCKPATAHPLFGDFGMTN